MDVLRRMFDARVLRRATVRIAAADLNRAAIEVIAVFRVQVAVVEVSSLIAVADRRMSAPRPVRVLMFLVTILAVHNSLPEVGCVKGKLSATRDRSASHPDKGNPMASKSSCVWIQPSTPSIRTFTQASPF